MRAATVPLILLAACGADQPARYAEPCTPAATDTFEPELAPGIEVNVHGVFAGGAAWLSYTVVEPGTSNGDVALARVGCDGATLETQRVTTRTGNNDTAAPLATSGDRVLVVWAGDDGEGPDNLDTFTRAFELDGTPVADDQALVTDLGGSPAMVSDWMPQVAADGDGFVVVGTRARPDLERFATYWQRVDGDGAPRGATGDPSLVPMVSHNFPAAAATDDGTVIVYIDTPDVDDDTLVWTMVPTGAAAAATPEQVVPLPSAGAPPVVAAHGAHAYAVVNTDDNGAANGGALSLWLRRLPGGAAADAVEVSPGATGDIYPAVAAGEGGGAIAWLRDGASRGLWLASFTDVDGTLTVGTPQQVPTTGSVAPYKPALVHLGEGFYLVAWHQVVASEYHLYARIVELG
ncbi:MAG: hypothetical protein R2939_20915 [Kofleriaceae bacterium]